MEDLKKEQIYENEIAHLKKEVVELHAKTAINEKNDNCSLESEINPNDFQFNHECMVKEEVIGQNQRHFKE